MCDKQHSMMTWCWSVTIFFYISVVRWHLVIIEFFLCGCTWFLSIEHKHRLPWIGFAFLWQRPQTNHVQLGSPSDFLWYLIVFQHCRPSALKQTSFLFFYINTCKAECGVLCVVLFFEILEILGIKYYSLCTHKFVCRHLHTYTHSCMHAYTHMHRHKCTHMDGCTHTHVMHRHIYVKTTYCAKNLLGIRYKTILKNSSIFKK